MSSRINLRLRPSASHPWLRSILQVANSVTEVTLEQGQLHARFASGNSHPVCVAGESRIGPRLTLLKIRASDTRSGSRLVVLANFGPGFRNVDPDEFRRMRMWLRLSQRNHSSPATPRTGSAQ